MRNNAIKRVLEFGCGDGNQLSLAHYPHYIGLDVSQTAIKNIKIKFSNDKNKKFYLVDEFLGAASKAQDSALKFDLTLSLDVIYHLIDDEVFARYMKNLFDFSSKFVIIYSSNKNEFHTSHVKHRKFSDFVDKHFKQFYLQEIIKNDFPFDESAPNTTSFCDFYIYIRK